MMYIVFTSEKTLCVPLLRKTFIVSNLQVRLPADIPGAEGAWCEETTPSESGRSQTTDHHHTDEGVYIYVYVQ